VQRDNGHDDVDVFVLDTGANRDGNDRRHHHRPSGAAVPGARVVAHNVDTGVDSPAKTNAAGIYRIEFLPIGKYTVSVEAQGFGTATVPAFQLEMLQTATFNLKLAVSGSSTTVDVSASAPILETGSATVDSTFTANTIENLPLNGLDLSAVTLYVPGAVSTYGTSGMTSIERGTYNSDLPE